MLFLFSDSRHSCTFSFPFPKSVGPPTLERLPSPGHLCACFTVLTRSHRQVSSSLYVLLHALTGQCCGFSLNLFWYINTPLADGSRGLWTGGYSTLRGLGDLVTGEAMWKADAKCQIFVLGMSATLVASPWLSVHLAAHSPRKQTRERAGNALKCLPKSSRVRENEILVEQR